MVQFSYTAKDGPQKIIQGNVEAQTEEQAISRVLQLGLTPLNVFISPPKVSATAAGSRRVSLGFRSKISRNDVTLFTRQAADLSDAGVPVAQMLQIIVRQTQQPALKKELEEISASVRDGVSLSSAMEQHPWIFSKLYVNMVRSGELGGQLPAVLTRLADLWEHDQETRSQVMTSLIYPLIILGVATITIFSLFTFVIPMLMTMFEDMETALPWPTVLIMAISSFFQKFWWLLILLVAGFIFYLKQLQSSQQGRLGLDRFKLRIPIWGRFLQVAEISRFSRSLATLVESGVVIVPALESVSALMDNLVMQQEVEEMAREVANGSSLTLALKGARSFPESVVNIISVGEETGELSKGLSKLAEYYERQTQRFIKRMTSLIEPMLILILGVVVGFIFVAMLLPILRMNLMIK